MAGLVRTGLGLVLGALLLAQTGAAAAKPFSAAVFDFELIDPSLEGTRGADPTEAARLKLISDVLRQMLGTSADYDVVDVGPAASKIADAGLIHGCNGCDADIAKGLGASRSITGTVRKMSTLILTISITVRDTATGQPVQFATADIRGNTDDSWTHGTKWLVRNRLLAH
ncbi:MULTISPECIES: DUF3280 domain-containing protein [Rhodomicrobium]|uniref:DUF3280 domain-containing protein n=1 Tax=Rhodomicrobium TaxID=1068 RepID=UPI000B4B1105|nr:MULTISPECIES: DUF3280 domain-containing protein [Rhodomicrobium]